MIAARAVPLLVTLVCSGLAGCGGNSTPPPPVEAVPPGQPVTGPTASDVLPLASGRFGDGSAWELTWETAADGRGSLCVTVADPAGDVQDCTRSSGPWFVGFLRQDGRQLLYATLPCGVAAVELRGAGGTVLDRMDTVAADDAALAVLEGPAPLGDVSLAALGHDGRELFVLERLTGDPSVPSVGC